MVVVSTILGFSTVFNPTWPWGWMFFEKEGAADKRPIDVEIGSETSPAHLCWKLNKISCRACLLSYCFLWQKSSAFKSSIGLYFQPLIIAFFWYTQLCFRIEKKIHTKTVGGVSRGEEGEFCKLFFLDGQITYLGEALAGGGQGRGGGAGV